MENLFTIFIIIMFVLGPLLEQMKKKEQAKQREQQPRPPVPRAPVPRPLPEARSSTEEISSKPRDPAAGMVPDDLWLILTGEQRPAPEPPTTLPPASSRRPWDVVYIPPEETEDEEELFREDVDVEVRRSSREAVRREHAARHKPVEAVSLEITQPNIISLEGPLPTAAARHSAFHRKIEQKPLAVVEQPARKAVLGLATRTELQRAFVLQEILGPPRGLE